MQFALYHNNKNMSKVSSQSSDLQHAEDCKQLIVPLELLKRCTSGRLNKQHAESPFAVQSIAIVSNQSFSPKNIRLKKGKLKHSEIVTYVHTCHHTHNRPLMSLPKLASRLPENS